MASKLTWMVAAAACIAGAVGGFSMGLFGSGKIEEPLQSFSYGFGGDMRGSHKSLKVKRLDDNYAMVISSKSEWHNDFPKVSENRVSAQLIKDIQKIFNAYEMAKLEKRPKSPFFAHDAGTSSYSFGFKEKEVAFNSNQQIPEKSYKGIKEIFTCVQGYCKEDNRLPGLVLPEIKKGEKHPVEPVEGKLTLVMFSYKDNTLEFYVNNGMTSKHKIDDSYKLVQLAHVEREITAKEGKHSYEAYAKQGQLQTIRLKERLEVGKYKLTYSGISCEFAIK